MDVTTRPLRYPPDGRPKEKGIDVQLAIDIVSVARDGAFDLAILFSSDTDLVPALNFVIDRTVRRIRGGCMAGPYPVGNESGRDLLSLP